MFYCLLAAWMAAAPPQPPPRVVPLGLPSGKTLEAELMIRDAERARGLMFRDSLAEDRVLLFVFESLGFHGIWMKNCRFPIDIVWLDEEHRIVHVEASVPPCDRDPCPVYQPMARAAYVVEMNSDKVAREKLAIGDRLSFELPR